MVAYYRGTVAEFLRAAPSAIVGKLQTEYANDQFVAQYTAQSRAWDSLVPLLRRGLERVACQSPNAASWSVLLEYPLHRLRKRIDVVILADSCIFTIEAKVGERSFRGSDERQAEEYALDLRDFHEQSRDRLIIPVLWATSASFSPGSCLAISGTDSVAPTVRIGGAGLAELLLQAPDDGGRPLNAEDWDRSAYRPVPNIIEAATSIFASHDVRALAQADASNLREAAKRLVSIIADSKRERRRALAFLTGVPGAGKTLAGLQVVHDAIA